MTTVGTKVILRYEPENVLSLSDAVVESYKQVRALFDDDAGAVSSARIASTYLWFSYLRCCLGITPSEQD